LSILFSFFTIKMQKGASVLMPKKLKTCSLSILVSYQVLGQTTPFLAFT